jgi:hypothetical protein
MRFKFDENSIELIATTKELYNFAKTLYPNLSQFYLDLDFISFLKNSGKRKLESFLPKFKFVNSYYKSDDDYHIDKYDLHPLFTLILITLYKYLGSLEIIDCLVNNQEYIKFLPKINVYLSYNRVE